MRKRARLTAMLTLLAATATTVALAGCGGKAAGSSEGGPGKSAAPGTTTTGPRKQPAHAPAY